MPCLSGFELYSRWVPLILRRGRLRVRDFLVLAPAFEPASFWKTVIVVVVPKIIDLKLPSEQMFSKNSRWVPP